MTSDPTLTTESLIDAVVRGVIDRLQLSENHSSEPALSTSEKGSTGSSQPYFLSGQVISVRSFHSVPAGTQQVLVQKTAVITPAAQDLARERRIQMVPADDDQKCLPALIQKVSDTCSTGWIGDVDMPQRGSALQAQLRLRGLTPDLVSWADLLAKLQAGQGVGLLLSDYPAVTVCDACRNPSIRAATIGEVKELNPLQDRLQPNLWVIDMGRASLAAAVFLAERVFRMVKAGGTE